jgi:hypothetical protein
MLSFICPCLYDKTPTQKPQAAVQVVVAPMKTATDSSPDKGPVVLTDAVVQPAIVGGFLDLSAAPLGGDSFARERAHTVSIGRMQVTFEEEAAARTPSRSSRVVPLTSLTPGQPTRPSRMRGSSRSQVFLRKEAGGFSKSENIEAICRVLPQKLVSYIFVKELLTTPDFEKMFFKVLTDRFGTPSGNILSIIDSGLFPEEEIDDFQRLAGALRTYLIEGLNHGEIIIQTIAALESFEPTVPLVTRFKAAALRLLQMELGTLEERRDLLAAYVTLINSEVELDAHIDSLLG